MKLLIPLLLLMLGLGGGVGAGLAMRPAADEAAPAVNQTAADQPAPPAAREAEDDDSLEYIKLNNQFVVPVMARDNVESIVTMAISLELVAGNSETVYRREPKLRDAFLQVLFDHANMGGFRGTYTDTNRLASLRSSLFDVARKTLGPAVKGVLITDLVRQIP